MVVTAIIVAVMVRIGLLLCKDAASCVALESILLFLFLISPKQPCQLDAAPLLI